jgi:hypothetical protein
MNRLPKKRGITQVGEDKSLILRGNGQKYFIACPLLQGQKLIFRFLVPNALIEVIRIKPLNRKIL